MSETNRRAFLQHTAAGLGAAAVAAAAQTSAAAPSSDRIVIGLIGPGGQGNQHLRALATNKNVQLAYLCEVDEKRLSGVMKLAESQFGTAPKAVKDMRQVFDDKSVDAVFIATPDHWHAPAAILACQAGKHVYVEKPCSHNLREGRLMIEAARKNNRVMQVGTQSRSTTAVMQAIDRVRDGVIGEILVAKVWNSQMRGSIGHVAPSDPPAHLDFDLWLGPAPLRPYRSNLLPSNWRWWYDFGAGDMGNDGVHDIDVACWGLGIDTHPSTITGLGGKYFFDDDQQFPDTQYVAFEYELKNKAGKKRQLLFEQRIWTPYVQEGYENGVAFYGTKGYMILGHTKGYELYAARNKLIEKKTWPGMELSNHHSDFFSAIKTGKKPNGDIEINHLSSALCHLGNIATRTGRTLHFDPQQEKIVNDSEASRMLRRDYREGHWAVPQGV